MIRIVKYSRIRTIVRICFIIANVIAAYRIAKSYVAI